MRRTLFRQALFKVQNVEVTYMDSCKTDRIMQRIAGRGEASGMTVWDLGQPWDRSLMREELWTVGIIFHKGAGGAMENSTENLNEVLFLAPEAEGTKPAGLGQYELFKREGGFRVEYKRVHVGVCVCAPSFLEKFADDDFADAVGQFF